MSADPNTSEICSECRFWRQFRDRTAYGYCYRYPGQVVVNPPCEDGPSLLETHQPTMMASEWCGEFQAKP